MAQEVEYDNLLAYGTYTLLYLNDTAINCILDAGRKLKKQNYGNYINNLYRKLDKEVQRYNRLITVTLKDDINQFAEFNGWKDELVDAPLLAYLNAIEKVYRDNDVPNAEFYATLEVARSLSEYAVNINDYIVEKIKVHNSAIVRLKEYRLTDVKDACNKFVRHVYALLQPQPTIVMNTESDVVAKFKILNEALLSLESFETTYNKTVESLSKQ